MAVVAVQVVARVVLGVQVAVMEGVQVSAVGVLVLVRGIATAVLAVPAVRIYALEDVVKAV